MNRQLKLLLAALVVATLATSNLRAETLPLAAFSVGGSGAGYTVAIDPTTLHDGSATLLLTSSAATSQDAYATSSWKVDASSYRGKRVRLKGFVKTAGVDRSAGLWMRVDGPTTVALDNMQPDRALSGDHDWTAVALALDVPSDATQIVYGGLLTAQQGKLWITAPDLEIVSETVAVTGLTYPNPAARAARPQSKPLDPFETFGFTKDAYRMAVDPSTKHGQEASLKIEAGSPQQNEFGASAWTVDATPYHGKRVRLSAFVMTAKVDSGASIWMRIDAPNNTQFDNMQPDRELAGDHDWTRLEVVLDVPKDAPQIVYGGLLSGKHGMMWMTAPVLESVADTVATTGKTITRPAPKLPATPALTQAERAAIVADLRATAVALSGTDPTAPLEDLRAIESAIGGARIVGLGEASHGTSEFFSMKHRLFRDLVERKGFTIFAIEGNQPEAREMDAYVTTGVGDPKHALAAMYFWTWQTQEVLGLAKWMRAYNAAPGKHPILHFAGFDMQTASVAIASVKGYVQEHSPADSASVERAYSCVPPSGYTPSTLTLEGRLACPAAVRSVAPLLARLNAGIDVVHDARVVEQYVEMCFAARNAGTRDKMMAENVEWVAAVKYPGQKIALWAHNYHISTDGPPLAMGAWLRDRFKGDYYRMGFAFDRGAVRAFSAGKLSNQTVPPAAPDALEGLLREAGPRYFVDLDGLSNNALRRWLDNGPIEREVGAVYDTDRDAAYYLSTHVRQRFDGLIFIAESHPAQPD
jgi:erythromycin esterase